jgi:hypothetical protein
MTVGEVPEQRVQRCANVHPMLDQTLGALIDLADLALGLVAVEKPIIAERFGVLRFRLPDEFGGLLFESFQLPSPKLSSGHLLPVCSSRRSLTGLAY